MKLSITKSKLNPLRGSSHIALPKWIEKKKALINIKNQDDECFKYAVTRALNPVEEHPERVSKQLIEQTKNYNWDRIGFPTPCSAKYFKKFEEKNNVSLNVFGHEGNDIIPLYVAGGETSSNAVAMD